MDNHNSCCLDHSGMLTRTDNNSKRIETVTRALDEHMREHRRNGMMIIITAISSIIAASGSIIAVLQ